MTHNQVLISNLHLIRKYESHFHSTLTHSLYMQAKPLPFTLMPQKIQQAFPHLSPSLTPFFQQQHISHEFVSSLTCNHTPISKQTPQSLLCIYSYRAKNLWVITLSKVSHDAKQQQLQSHHFQTNELNMQPKNQTNSCTVHTPQKPL
jgi:hypothetical protein